MAIKQLHASHYLAITELAKPSGQRKTVDEIAVLCGVHRSTIFEWKKDPTFERELKRQIVRGTIGRLPDVFEAIPDIIIKDGNAAMFKALLQAHDMLTDKVEVNTSDNSGNNIDRAALQARLDKLKKQQDGE